MSGEKILIPMDSLEGPTGFATNGRNIAWALADEYDVHILGLQSVNTNKVKIDIGGEVREVIQYPNLPRGKQKWDFGTKSLPRLLNKLDPDILLTINDIQMIQHVPDAMYPSKIDMRIMDLPSKTIVSTDALIMELKANIDRFLEKYPRKTKWILLGPQDGIPPMPQWRQIYTLADQVVAMSKFGQKVYSDYFNMEVPYIYHGIDTDLFVPQEMEEEKDTFVIGNLNRNQPRKQPVRTMRAFAKFAKDKDDVRLHMQMDWNDIFGWPLRYFASIFKIMDKIIPPMQIPVAYKYLPQIYNQWDINVNSTGGEGFGITTIEGASCGLPNIITDYTTSKELVIDGKPSPRGILVPPLDLYWDRLDVAAVQRSLIDEDKLAEIKTEVRQFCQKFPLYPDLLK